jgi:4a-hydroxytetrahydrobiopterin dehydratase
MSKPLVSEKISAALVSLPGWTCKRDALERTFKFGSFREAMGFMGRVAFEAEELNHHPDWKNSYNRVTVRLSTHDAGGKVTARDVELARRIQKISWVAVP